jgi:hypothetical protein
MIASRRQGWPTVFLGVASDPAPFLYANMILVPKLSKCMFLTFDCVNFYPFLSQVIKE